MGTEGHLQHLNGPSGGHCLQCNKLHDSVLIHSALISSYFFKVKFSSRTRFSKWCFLSNILFLFSSKLALCLVHFIVLVLNTRNYRERGRPTHYEAPHYAIAFYLLLLPHSRFHSSIVYDIQGGSNMTGTDLYVNKPHCAAAVRP